jgi:hypothetical protein
MNTRTINNQVKPTKPDEAAYKASLAEAEKEHAAAQEKLVWMPRVVQLGLDLVLFAHISHWPEDMVCK